MTASSSMFARVQEGRGRLVASASATAGVGATQTRLTELSHKAPVRWIPLLKSSARADKAAICYIGNYGGGMLQGDVSKYTITVDSNAKLALLTQGSNRIYKKTLANSSTTSTRVQYNVKANGILVVAPDPITPFAGSSYQQKQVFTLDPTASLVAIDWFSAGRYVNGERWQFDRFGTETVVEFTQEDGETQPPFMIDRIELNQNSADESCWGMDWENLQLNAYASILLYSGNGSEELQSVVERCHKVQEDLISRYTRARQSSSIRNPKDGVVASLNQEILSGRVLMGMTSMPTADHDDSIQPNKELTMIRLAATSNEDLYRIFHYCLQPLKGTIGVNLYQDRIRAVYSAPMKFTPRKEKTSKKPAVNQNYDLPWLQSMTNPTSFWSAMMIADSAFPVGSFAYSAGLEAAHQLGLFQGDTTTDLETFVNASVRSSMQLTVPYLVQSHVWATTRQEQTLDDEMLEAWLNLDREVHRLLVSNGPACSASLDQGRNLMRIATQWAESSNASHLPTLRILDQKLLKATCTGHAATCLGVILALQGLSVPESIQLVGYCAARDIVSAAVRLNIIGPMASVGILSQASQIVAARLEKQDYITTVAASCAPAIEAIQPCHDKLAMRLFRS